MLTAPKPPPEDIEEGRGPKPTALAPVGFRGQSSLALASFCYYYLPAPRRSSCGLLDRLLARRLILRRELELASAELQVVGVRGVLQDTLLVGEVAGLAELQLSQTRVVVVALDGELVLCSDLAALVLGVPNLELHLREDGRCDQCQHRHHRHYQNQLPQLLLL